MDNVFKKLRTEVLGHDFWSDPIGKKDVCRNPEHMGAWVENCWKAHVNAYFTANAGVELYETTADSYAQDIVALQDPGAVMNKFLFVAEGITTDGQRAMYTDSTADMAVWDELGMVSWVDAMVRAQIANGDAHG